MWSGCTAAEQVVGEERCVGGADEDGDGELDCQDADCAAHPACLGRVEHCYNGADDDGDGQLDCQDADCAARDVCALAGEDCLDGVDNNADGQIDCADQACAQAWVCLRGGEDCLDGLDNDADGQVDCADPACARTAFCLDRREVCDNLRDDDGDGLADCQDADCARTIACMAGGEACGNRRDDDGDGLADCQDTDCAYTASCAARREDCGNGVDDDGDDLIDCADSSCASSSICLRRAERCEGGVDEDGDGQIDCADSDCAGVYLCLGGAENCLNGVDDNGDNDVDCADMLCATHSRCADRGQEVCGNRRDDDGDGQADCADSDCAMSQTCQAPVERCSNNMDDDGDGQIDCADSNCAGDPACPAVREDMFFGGVPGCGDGVDNDGDGQLDCKDLDCNEPGVFNSVPCTWVEIDCADSFDNDGDDQVDCADSDCATDAACAPQELCGNNMDDDSDGQTDCADPDCAAACDPGSCTSPRVLTGAGITGALPLTRMSLRGVSCSTASFTAPEVVLSWTASASGAHCFAVQTDGFAPALAFIDAANSCQASGECQRVLSQTLLQATFNATQGQGYFLVLDQDSINAPGQRLYTLSVTPGACDPMAAELCADGLDNDADALIDCADPACAAEPSCTTGELCDFNGVDDDGDGATDCADSECVASNPLCGPESGAACVDGFDNDGNGVRDCQDFVACGMEPQCRFGTCDNPLFATGNLSGSITNTNPSLEPSTCAYGGAPSGEELAFIIELFQPGPHCLLDIAQEIPLAMTIARVDGLSQCGDATELCAPVAIGHRVGLTAGPGAAMQPERLYVVLDSVPNTAGNVQFDLRSGPCAQAGTPFAPLYAEEIAAMLATTIDGDATIEPDVNNSVSPCFALGMPVGARESVHKWRPTASGPYCISTAGSTFDTVLYVRDFFDASFGMDRVCALHGAQGAPQAEATLTVTDTDELAIIVDGQTPAAQGGYTLTITPGACP